MAAPESRCGLEVQQTSVKKQTHFLCPFSFQFSLETIYCFCCHRIIRHTLGDKKLHLAMRADNTPAGLSVLAECTTDVRQWYLQNGLQLNPGQVRSSYHRNHQSAASSDVICVRGRSRYH